MKNGKLRKRNNEQKQKGRKEAKKQNKNENVNEKERRKINNKKEKQRTKDTPPPRIFNPHNIKIHHMIFDLKNKQSL